MSRQYATGFTLLELMVTIAILAIVLALGLPSFQGSLRSNRLATSSNELLASFALARSESVRSTRGGGVCASANGTACGGTWNDGWIVWTETNGDGVFNAGETITRYSQGRGQLQVTSSAAAIAFDGRGLVRNSAGETISLVAVGASNQGRCVALGLTGQTTLTKEACP